MTIKELPLSLPPSVSPEAFRIGFLLPPLFFLTHSHRSQHPIILKNLGWLHSGAILGKPINAIPVLAAYRITMEDPHDSAIEMMYLINFPIHRGNFVILSS